MAIELTTVGYFKQQQSIKTIKKITIIKAIFRESPGDMATVIYNGIQIIHRDYRLNIPSIKVKWDKSIIKGHYDSFMFV